MHRFPVVRRPPGALERVLGRRRVRRLRRRAGLAALGTGMLLLRPRRLTSFMTWTCALTVTLALTFMVTR
jgi:hypothetical protein